MKELIAATDRTEIRFLNLSASESCHSLRVLAICALAATCQAAVLELPDATITGLTHTFGHFGSGGPDTWIIDAPVVGQFSQPSFTATLTGSETVVLRFEAPVGQKFVVHAPPAGFGNISLYLGGRWWGSLPEFPQSPVSRSFTFENLFGPTPLRRSSFDVVGIRGGFVEFSDTFTIASGTEFTAVELSALYDFSIANPVNLPFRPDGITFQCEVTSSQILGDGTLMTLELIPEPNSLALLLLMSSGLACFHRRVCLARQAFSQDGSPQHREKSARALS